MNKINEKRKKYFGKSGGFSKYDNNGNVIYSESVGIEGETVRHFYFYDEFGRRIRYKKEESNNIFEEYTKYLNNGSKEVISIILPSYTMCIRKYNNLGRLLEEETQDKEGNGIRRIYDAYRDTYNIFKFKIPFTYIL